MCKRVATYHTNCFGFDHQREGKNGAPLATLVNADPNQIPRMLR
jgi:hypothetical protein